jgi:large subunit ribosomal protein L4
LAVLVVEPIEWAPAKTKQAVTLLAAIGAVGKTLLVLNHTDEAAHRAFRNLPNVVIAEPGHITTYDVLWSDQVLFTTSTLQAMSRTGGYAVGEADFVKESVGGESA